MSALVSRFSTLDIHLTRFDSPGSPVVVPSRNHKIFFSTTSPIPHPFEKESPSTSDCEDVEETEIGNDYDETEKVKLDLAVYKANQWLREGEGDVDEETVDEILRSVYQILRCSGHRMDHYEFLAMLIYGDRYVQKACKIGMGEVFYLFLISATTAIKFLEDEGDINSEATSIVAGLTVESFLYMERVYLQHLDYELNISMKNVEWLIIDWTTTLPSAKHVVETIRSLQSLQILQKEVEDGSS